MLKLLALTVHLLSLIGDRLGQAVPTSVIINIEAQVRVIIMLL